MARVRARRREALNVNVVIVGGGVAGLTCARVLLHERVSFVLVEREPVPGGRVRTDVTDDGFRLDRGFQVLFTRYPAVRRHVDLAQLGVRAFAPGAIVVDAEGQRSELDDPIRSPAKAWRTLRSPVLSLADKGRIALEAADLRLRIAEGIWTDRDTTTNAYLLERGFSPQAIDRFFRPFFGGIFLDRSLSTSSNAFRFIYKMLAEGDTVVPALGMGELPRQLAATLPPASLRLGVGVDELLRENGRVTGVRCGEELLHADAVVLATDGPSAAALSGLPVARNGAGVTTLYFAGPAPLIDDRRIMLNAAPEGFVNELAQISNVAPDYAPPGEHLLSVTVLGVPAEDDAEVEHRVRGELADWFGFGADAVAEQRLIALLRTEYALLEQPQGFVTELPPVRTEIAGLYIGGEATRSSSINGAMEAGEAAARAVIEDLLAAE